MQHFGAPTRLLDATFSPYIASYFALESGYKDCCVFAFNHRKLIPSNYKDIKISKLKEIIFKNLEDDESFIMAYKPIMSNERIEAQQGLFLIPSTVNTTFEYLMGFYNLSGKECLKIIIPAELRYEGLERLRMMNITTAALFPGLDGFCRSLRYEVLEPFSSQELLSNRKQKIEPRIRIL